MTRLKELYASETCEIDNKGIINLKNRNKSKTHENYPISIVCILRSIKIQTTFHIINLKKLIKIDAPYNLKLNI